MEKYIEQIRKVAIALGALNEGLHALGKVYNDTEYLASRDMTQEDVLAAISDLGDLGGYIRTLFTVADAIEQQLLSMERQQQRPAEAPTKSTDAAKSGPEEISNVELIGFIALLLAKIEARDDADTSTMEQIYEDVLRRYRAKSKGV